MQHLTKRNCRARHAFRPLALTMLVLGGAIACSIFAQPPSDLSPTFSNGGKVIDERLSNQLAVTPRPEGNCFIGGSSNHDGGIPVPGGTFSLQIYDYEVCGWNAWAPSWITLRRTNGVGDATVEYTVQPNPEGPRRGLIFVSGNGSSSIAVTVYQFGGGVLDFDGDARADISVFRPGEGNWYLQRSRDGFAVINWGLGTDKIVPADYDGDGKTDIAVFRPSEGKWYVLQSSDGTFSETRFGIAEDIPAPADFDGDGLADITVYRPSTGTWWIRPTYWGGWRSAQFGISEDIPVVGDYNGNGRADLAMFRPSNGTWYYSDYLQDPSNYFAEVQFGVSTDLVAPADFDGDGKTDIAVYRPSTGTWYIRINGELRVVPFGAAEDIPTAADYDGDGQADISVFRPLSGVWYRLNSGDGSFSAFQFGLSGDRPIPNAHVP